MRRKRMSATPPADLEPIRSATLERPFSVIEPQTQFVPVVVDIPHAGRSYLNAFLRSAKLSAHGLRRSEDAFVDRLFHDAAALGAVILKAEFPRAYLDVNREPFELDPRMFDGHLPAFANTRSLRVMSGLGTVPKLVGDGQEIYAGRIPVEEALGRIESVYRPYHATLRTLIDRTVGHFGACVLVDAHSMPSSSLARERNPRPDIVLGDRFGASASGWLVDALEAGLRREGFRVVRNRPYAGGYVTEAYGQPRQNRHAIQIEINRAIYMDERRIEPAPAFEDIRRALRGALAGAFADWANRLAPGRLAAE